MKQILIFTLISLITQLLSLAAPDASIDSEEGKQKSTRYLGTGGERQLNVVYKEIGKRDLMFDVYYPTAHQSEKSPVVIYAHGGGWAVGSRAGATKALFAPLFTQLLAEGFCVVSVDYRLYNKGGAVAMRDCVIDSKDAVRYLVKNARSLGIDPDRLYVFGDSAGGQIAQMLLLSPPDSLTGDSELADVDYKIQAGVSWYGPCDFEDMNLFNHDNSPDFVDRFSSRIVRSEVSAAQKLRLYREMSPINYLKQSSPPLLMIQGDNDTTIPVKHAYHMQRKASELQAPVEVLIVENAGHNWRRAGGEVDPSKEEITELTLEFFMKQLKTR